ncbi:MAG: DNA polymerase III subunit alpha [Deltaproteobacteria bacterium]|nr:MAG: DNA polymerase III subunit alpha [Deltaproteobacteria bacterium]
MRQADFVHLHVHSAYSLLQSTIRLPQLVKRARHYRLPALAITDHGNLFGCVEFYELAYGQGIKPIIGCELGVRFTEDTETEPPGASLQPAGHLVLLATNRKGYQHLLQLLTLAHAHGWQPEPYITRTQLSEHRQGLIVLSGCLRGEIPAWLFKGEERRATERAAEYLELFGREYFFIEIQPPLTNAHRLLNKNLLELAHQLDLQVVATANCHTLGTEEAELLRILAAIRLGITVDEVAPPAEHSFLSPEEMKTEFAHLPEAIGATVSIAERCNVDFDLGKIHLPRFPLERGQEAQAFLVQKARSGLKERVTGEKAAEERQYRQRLDRELETIQRLHLADYFLVISDFVEFARRTGVPVGPGSGSASSSLTAYALGITEIDPLRHDLLFEHLVNPLSPELPHIDLGFGMEMRDQVRQYLRSKYGADRVAHITSLGTMQWRTAVRDLGKALGVAQEDMGVTVAHSEEAETEQKENLAPDLSAGEELSVAAPARILELAAALEGLPRQVGTHATGVVIGDGPLVLRVPLYRGSREEWISQYGMRALRRVGLVKFDLIARKTLTVIRKALTLVEAESQASVTLDEVARDDESTFDLLCRGSTAGIPYLETATARDLLLKWQPRKWHDLLVLLALLPPAIRESGLTERLLQERRAAYSEESLTPKQPRADRMESILFDVDLTKYIGRTTGWSLEKASQLCHLLMKPEEGQAESLRLEFFQAAERRGHSPTEVEAIWSRLGQSAAVVADKSRTVAQALTIIQAAFIKARFPWHFMAALLSSELHQPDLMAAHVEVCREEGIEVLSPNINTSEVEFTVESGAIRVGLAAVRQVSQTTAKAIVKARRERGPFHSLAQLCGSIDPEHLGKRALTALIKAGALDSLQFERHRLMEMLPEVISQARFGQMGLFDPGSGWPPPKTSSSIKQKEDAARLAQEKEALGFYLSGHPLSLYRHLLETLAPGGSTTHLRHLPEGSNARVGGVIEWIRVISSRKKEPLCFLRLEDLHGAVQVVIFADVYAVCEKYVVKGTPIFVSGRVAREGGDCRLIADGIMSLDEAAVSLTTSVHLHLTVEGVSVQELGRTLELIKSQPGKCPVYLHLHIGRQIEVVQKLPPRHWVLPTTELKARLEQEFGVNCLDIRYGENEETGS